MTTIKQHLEQRGYEVVLPTPALIRYWWVRCLREVFGYTSPSKEMIPVTIDVRPQPHEWAACHWPGKEASSRLHLTHHDEPISRRGLLTVILHEIVHAVLVYEGRGGREAHCSHFMDYAALIEARTGLPLQDSYSREDILAMGRRAGINLK